MSTVIGIIIGLITGLAASTLFWWWQTKLLQPKISLCPTLARYEIAGGREQCELKIINHGRRSVADITLTIRLVVPDLTILGANQFFRLREESLPWLDPGEDQYYYISPSQLSSSSKRDYGHYFPERISEAFKSGNDTEISMWDLIRSCDGAALKAYVAASDSFSGARGFSTRTFQLSDFRSGTFLEGNTCDHSGQLKDVQEHGREPVHGEA